MTSANKKRFSFEIIREGLGAQISGSKSYFFLVQHSWYTDVLA